MQIGLSPKLYPAVVLIALGILVALLVDHTTGVTMIGTGTAALGLGYVAPVGEVIPGPVGEGSDARMNAKAAAKLNKAGR